MLSVLAACGGPSSSNPQTPSPPINPSAVSSIKGTAATGSPLAKAQVTVRGATSGEVAVDAAADGSYNLSDTQQATLAGTPYLVQACGTTDAGLYVCLYSASNEVSVINATPLTHAALALAVKDDPATIFNQRTAVNWDTFSTKLDLLTTALSAYVSKLGIKGNAAGLVKTSFTANHTGVDAMLDAVKVVTDTMEQGKVSVTLVNRAKTSEFLVVADATNQVANNKIADTNAPVLSSSGEHTARLAAFKTAAIAAMDKARANDVPACKAAMPAITASNAVINTAAFCDKPGSIDTLNIIICQGDLCRVSFGGGSMTLRNDGGTFKFSGRAIDTNDCVNQVRWEANRNFWLNDGTSQIQRAVNIAVPTSCATPSATLTIASAIVSIPNANGTWKEFYRLKKGCPDAQTLDLLNSTNFDGGNNPNGSCGSKQFNKLDGKRFNTKNADSTDEQIAKAEALIAQVKANGAVFQIELFSDDNFATTVATVVKPVGGYIASWGSIDRLPWPALTDESKEAFKTYDRTKNFSAQFKTGSAYLQSADIRNQNMDKRGTAAIPGRATSADLPPNANWVNDEKLLLQINAKDSEGGQLQTNYHLQSQ